MLDFFKRYQVIISSLVFLLISLQIASYNVKGSGAGSITREFIYFFTSPIQYTVTAVKNTTSSVFNNYFDLVDVKKENDELKIIIDKLNNENNNLREQLAFGKRINSLQTFDDSQSFTTKVARIIGASGGELSGSWSRTITVDLGRVDGIEELMAVIVPQGIVGKVISVERRTSQVLLVTDPRFSTDIVLQRSRTRALASGTGSEEINIKYIRQLDQALNGEALITAGISGLYPKGLTVGHIVEIDSDSTSFYKKIKAIPTVRADNLEEVLIITSYDTNEGGGR